ncbi:hypothetical protein ACROYT_G010196 [Oculina patagonica]
MQMSATRFLSSEQKISYTSEDFQWPSPQNCDGKQKDTEPSKFDKELKETWDAAADAGYFTYKLDHVEGRVAPGKYCLYIQLNELRFTKRRKPDPMNRVSEPFNPAKFNFTKVHSKEVLFELCPKHRIPTSNDHHLMIINLSPLEYGHSLLVPSLNSCLPQILTEEGIFLSLETTMLTNHRGFRLGFNSLCAYSSVNHLHFHTWYSDNPSYLETVDVIPVCEEVFEVRDYPTTTFVFELGPQTNVSLLARKIHQVSSYFVTNEVAHTYLILRGDKCSSTTQKSESGNKESDHSVIRVFLWPRNPVCGAEVKSSYESDERPMAVCEFSGFVAVETREIFNSFTEEQFCEYMRRATLPEEQFVRHRESMRELLNK